MSSFVCVFVYGRGHCIASNRLKGDCLWERSLGGSLFILIHSDGVRRVERNLMSNEWVGFFFFFLKLVAYASVNCLMLPARMWLATTGFPLTSLAHAGSGLVRRNAFRSAIKFGASFWFFTWSNAQLYAVRPAENMRFSSNTCSCVGRIRIL